MLVNDQCSLKNHSQFGSPPLELKRACVAFLLEAAEVGSFSSAIAGMRLQFLSPVS